MKIRLQSLTGPVSWFLLGSKFWTLKFWIFSKTAFMGGMDLTDHENDLKNYKKSSKVVLESKNRLSCIYYIFSETASIGLSTPFIIKMISKIFKKCSKFVLGSKNLYLWLCSKNCSIWPKTLYKLDHKKDHFFMKNPQMMLKRKITKWWI